MEKVQRRQDHCTQINNNTPQATQMCLSYLDRKAVFDSATLKLIFTFSFGCCFQGHFNKSFCPYFLFSICRGKNLIMDVGNLVRSCTRLRRLVEGQVDYHRKESITHAGVETNSSQV